MLWFSAGSVETSTLEPVWFIVLVSSGAAVIVSGLICFCRFASKKRRKLSMKPDVSSQGIGMSCSGPAETYFMITSVPATSQPISEDVLVNKEQKQGNPEDKENVYHLYATIPDKPVHSKTEDHVYSLVKMNWWIWFHHVQPLKYLYLQINRSLFTLFSVLFTIIMEHTVTSVNIQSIFSSNPH